MTVETYNWQTLNLINWLHGSSRTLKIISSLVLITFSMLILAPTAQAVQEYPLQTEGSTDNPESELSTVFEQIVSQLDALKAAREANQDTTVILATLKDLGNQVAGLDKAVMDNFNQLETELTEKQLPPEILQRHHDMVTHYQVQRDAWLEQLEAETDTGFFADLLRTIQGWLGTEPVTEKVVSPLQPADPKQFKRKHQPFDPNDLPWSTPDGSKTRKPSETSNQLSNLTGVSSKKPAIMLAANIITPEMLGLPGGPTTEDLIETIDVQITDTIREKAKELDDDPVKIYNWVRNNIEFIPTYGSIQGAGYTLQKGKGNAFDTSSLLIALYRAANIPARYAYGTVDIPAEKAMNWVGGVTVPQAAQQLLGQGGIPNTGLAQGGKITHIRMEHIWVEAWVDYFPSRAAKHKVGDSWIPLDPSFKQYEYSDPTLDITNLTYEGQALIENHGAEHVWTQESQSQEFDAALNSYIDALEQLVDTNHIDDDVEDLFGRKKLIIKEHGILASGLPYKVNAQTNNFSQIPENLRHKVRYTLSDSFGSSEVISYETSLPEIAGKGLSVGFKPATDSDKEALINLLPTSETATIHDLPNNIPGYLIKVSAEVNVDGTPAVSSGSFTLGADVKHKVALYSPTQGWQSREALGAAGEYRAIGLDLHGIDAAELEAIKAELEGVLDAVNNDETTPVSQLGFVEKILQLGVKQYFATVDKYAEQSSRYQNVVQYRLPSFGYFHTTVNTSYFFGVPRYASFTGVTMDIPRLNTISTARDNHHETWVKHNRQTGLVASYLENAIPEEVFFTGELKPEGISAAKALDLALSQGQQVYVIDSSNSTELNNVSIDFDSKQKIQSAINAGKEVTVHASPITINGWVGSGYLIIDPQTGAGGYLISGGANGGFLGIDEDTWLGMLSIGIDFIPGVGSVRAIIELITGKDLITGEPINRFILGFAVLASFVGGAAAVKGLGKAANKMATAGRTSNEIGQAGEAAVNVAKGLPDGRAFPQAVRTFTINGRTRIADGVNVNSNNYTQMWEVKSVKKLDGSYEEQIQDYLDYSKSRGVDFELYIRGSDFAEPTHITKPMKDFLDENNVVVKYIGDL